MEGAEKVSTTPEQPMLEAQARKGIAGSWNRHHVELLPSPTPTLLGPALRGLPGYGILRAFLYMCFILLRRILRANGPGECQGMIKMTAHDVFPRRVARSAPSSLTHAPLAHSRLNPRQRPGRAGAKRLAGKECFQRPAPGGGRREVAPRRRVVARFSHPKVE